jgi:hypothetical protein
LLKLEAKPMMPYAALDEEFFAKVLEFDQRVAAAVAERRCSHCGGPLHRSNYRRKPRGGLIAEAGEAFAVRLSLCCGREGCRKRATPPSLRFLGRRVYLEVVVLLASSAAVATRFLKEVHEATGVPVRTLRRWLAWWSAALPLTATWLELRARFVPPPPVEAELPKSLLERLVTGPPPMSRIAAVQLAARLLAPLTTQSVLDGARFVSVAAAS